MARSSGQSIVLASTLALLSYVPFEIVAKISLIFCALIFILDPIPPVSRLSALIGIVVVSLLAKVERRLREGQIDFEVQVEEQEGQVQESVEAKDNKKED